MDIGLSLRHQLQASPSELRRLAQRAEDAGFHSLWVPHHTVVPLEYESRYPYQTDSKLPFPAKTIYGDSMAVLSHLAAVTDKVRLATGVIPMMTQHPISLAKQVATVDHLSGGRVDLGIGTGWLFEEGEILGLPTDHRGQRLDEAIEIMRRAWTGEPFSHDGRFWQIRPSVCSPAPAQGPDVPIWIGGGSPAAMRTLESHGAGLILPPGEAGLQLLVELGPALSADKRIAVPLAVSVDAEESELVERCSALHRAGASLILLNTEPDAGKAMATVDRFGEQILPQLGATRN